MNSTEALLLTGSKEKILKNLTIPSFPLRVLAGKPGVTAIQNRAMEFLKQDPGTISPL